MKTSQGKTTALEALEKRRQANKGRKRIDNGSLPAGAPMFFDCLTCGDEMSFPESYVNRTKLCDECQALKDVGWLE
jgi:hypothetical protein